MLYEVITHLRDGLVLVTGPTGSGKSTTLASIIDKINANYAKHIVTIDQRAGARRATELLLAHGHRLV